MNHHALLASLYARARLTGLLQIQLTILEIDCLDAWLAGGRERE